MAYTTPVVALSSVTAAASIDSMCETTAYTAVIRHIFGRCIG